MEPKSLAHTIASSIDAPDPMGVGKSAEEEGAEAQGHSILQAIASKDPAQLMTALRTAFESMDSDDASAADSDGDGEAA